MRDRRLYLVRHGLADRSDWDGPDHLRPLTPEGQDRMQRSAAFMAELDLGVDLILSSPLARALQTAEIVAEALAPVGGLLVDERLACGFGTRDLACFLKEYPEAERLLLAGHEPDFSTVAGHITGGSHLVCKKGSLLRIDLWGEEPPRGTLAWLIPPRVLAGD